MTYQPPPVMPGPEPASWTPSTPAPTPARSKTVPVLLAIIAVLLLTVGGLAYALLRGSDSGAGSSTKTGAASFAQIKTDCGVVAGYQIGDAGKTVDITVGSAYMNETTAACLFDKIAMPDAVRDHIASTRALDGQQTDQWAGYTARWTYHPDAGLKMTIRAA